MTTAERRRGAALPLKDDKKAGNSQNGGQPGGRPPQKGEKRRKGKREKVGKEAKKQKRKEGCKKVLWQKQTNGWERRQPASTGR